ncbi:aminotransferase class IV [Demequina pelophila]|uniref:aminotransferase class IV n=1 Tax=Demequina pelophila TaxID=1638984 RepID=UPI0007824B44|nr:aminotransferase class IV [Demequina pelophila]
MPVLVLCGSPAAGVPSAPARVIDPSTPIATATDQGLTRGDGVFESVGVHHGRIHDLEPHLERLAQSASMLDLPAPDLGDLRDAVATAVREFLAPLDAPPPTVLVKIVYTRGGAEASPDRPAGSPFGFVYADEFPDPRPARRDGVSAITLTRGYPLGIGASAPWLTIGAKTLSYAVNMAALRHAAARGAQEVVFTTTDGFVLEAPRSTVLVRYGGMVSTPEIDGGLLHGTAQRAAFEAFEARGFTCDYRAIRVDELASADAIWLADSAFLLRPLHTLDGRELAIDRELTGAVVDDMLARA